ncbi:MAG: hypothetical protein EBU08_14140 [Micrococcales bacterium]|nr:hypothetical protein [Micrococcales bacterium]
MEYRPEKTAIGVPNLACATFFGFHKATQIVQSVHHVEHSHHIYKRDRQFRMAVTVADQAIQGPGSVQFSREECRVDQTAEDPIAIGICRFHISDGLGVAVDNMFRETSLFDQLQRLVRRYFAWGTGHLILKAVARRFHQMATDIEQESKDMLARSRDLFEQGKPLAAARVRLNASKHAAEARALHVAGWTQWHAPQAPKADGTRKVVYQSKGRAKFFQIFGLIHWGLKCRMQQSLESSREARKAAGKSISAKTGQNTKAMRAWRSLGKAICNIDMLVFQMGRSDFRQKHVAAYAFKVQVTLGLSPMESVISTSESMMAAIGALVAIQGIVRMLQGLCRGLSFQERISSSGKKCGVITNALWLIDRRLAMPSATGLRLTSKTLLAHHGWRCFPLLPMRLTDRHKFNIACFIRADNIACNM